MDLTERDNWIRKRYKELKQKKSDDYEEQIYIQISEELNKKYPLLWVDFETIRHICKGYGYYREEK
jgi:hypothetical protein